MDTSIYYRSDPQSVLQIQLMKSLRDNTDPKVILIRAFAGGHAGRTIEPFYTAIRRATATFHARGITLRVEIYTNNYIKNVVCWSPGELVDRLLRSDVHLLATHLHEGNIGKTIEWNIPNILANTHRLQFHLGNFMADNVFCPVNEQGKMPVYTIMPDYCLPTVAVTLPALDWIDDPDGAFIASEEMDALHK
jgi:hypothetical protein